MSKKQQKKNYSQAYNRGGKNYSERNQKSAEAKPKKKLITLASIALALAAVLTLSLIFSVYEPPYLGEITNDAPDTVSTSGTITNGSFTVANASSLAQYPYNPASWTYTKRNANETIGGIVSTADDEKEKVTNNLKNLGKNIGLTETLINNVLYGDKLSEAKDNAGKAVEFEDDDNGNLMLMYNAVPSYQKVVSQSFMMNAGEYKLVRVWVKTGASAAVDITLRVGPSTTSYEERFLGVSTGGKWVAYDFYLEANAAWSKTLHLEIALGTNDDPATGIVLVDQAEMRSIHKSDFIKMKYRSDGTLPEPLQKNEKVKSYDELVDSTNLFDTNNLLAGATGQHTTIDSDAWVAANEEENKYPFYDKNDIFVLKNESNSVKSKSFKIPGFEILPSTASDHYRISFWLKTDISAINKGAYLYLKTYRNGAAAPDDRTATLSLIRTTTTEDVNSGWMNCVFYVKPSNTDRYNLELVISLGKEIPLISDTPTLGTVLATEFEMVTIEKSDYNSASTDTRSTKIDLGVAMETGSITNGNFNTPTEPATGNSNLGIAPSGWAMRYKSYMDGDVRKYYENFNYGIVPYTTSATGNYGKYIPTDAANISKIFSLPGRDNVFAVKGGGGTEKFAFSAQSNKFDIPQYTNRLISVLVYTDAAYLPYLTISLQGDLTDDSGNPIMVYNGGEIDSNNLYRTPVDYCFYETDTEDGHPAGTYIKINFLVSTGELSKSTFLQIDFGTPDKLADANAWFVIDEARTVVLSDENYEALLEGAFGEVNKDIETEIILSSNFSNIQGKDYTKIDLPDEDEDNDDDEDETDDEETPREPFNWLYLSSIIFGFAIIIFLASVIIKHFKLFRRKETFEVDDGYKRK